jgi:hypothetical protein
MVRRQILRHDEQEVEEELLSKSELMTSTGEAAV